MSAEDRIVELRSDNTGEGPCPVCHKPRAENGCWTSWSTELESGGLGSKKGWNGRVGLNCQSFTEDRHELAEALNRYHVRPEEEEG